MDPDFSIATVARFLTLAGRVDNPTQKSLQILAAEQIPQRSCILL